MYQKIGELIGNIIPFVIFLYLTLIVFGIIDAEKKPKILEKPSVFLKSVIIIGTIGFGILIVMQLIK